MARINKRSIASIAISFSAAALVALGTAIPGLADTQVQVSGGLLTGGVVMFRDFGVFNPLAPNVPTAIILNGSKQTPTATFGFSDIVNATGTAGWTLKVNLSQFTGTSSNLPTGSLTLRQVPLISLRDGTSSPLSAFNASTLSSTMAMDTGVDIVLFKTTTGGLGSYSVSPAELALSLPADTKVDTYISTATVTLS